MSFQRVSLALRLPKNDPDKRSFAVRRSLYAPSERSMPVVNCSRVVWPTIHGFVWALACFCGLTSSALADAPTRLSSYQAALSVVERSLAAHGGIDDITDSGVVVELEGSFDLSVRMQGRSPGRSEITPIKERIVADLAGDRLRYEIDWFNYFSSNQQLGEIYDSDGRVPFLDFRTKSGGYLPRETVVDAKERYQRVLPNVLLADALQRRQTLQNLGPRADTGTAYDRVSYVTEAGDLLTLHIDQESRLLASASTIIDMPLLGDVEVEWRWDRYAKRQDLTAPRRYRVFLDGKQMKDATMAVALGADAGGFDAPPDFSIGPRPEVLEPRTTFVPYGGREPIIDRVAPEVYLARSLRPGFQLLFVEFADFVLAVDAPTGWYEMQQIPPMNWSTGDGTSSLGEKYLRAIKTAVPDKPLKYVVLTHHHSDHIGGLRPFIAEDVEILAGVSAAQMAKQAAASTFTLSPDALTGSQSKPIITVVDGEYAVENGDMEVRLIELPDGNPKAQNYLMVYLPKQKILYTTGFIYPVAAADFPPPESIDLSIYFVEWLDQSGLDIEKIYNVHAGGLVEDWHLEKVREIAASRASSSPK